MKWPSLPVRPDGLAARLVDERHDVLVDEAAQHHLDHVERLLVGDAHALDELALLAELLQQRADLRPAPCTTTGFMPISLSSTTSSAKSSCSATSVMALPPYLMTMVRS
jgi:hypothetical protein